MLAILTLLVAPSLLHIPYQQDIKVVSAKPASLVLKTALAKAAQTKKLVFVSFSASWCGPCRQLHHALETAPAKSVWDKYFVSASLTVFENGEKVKLNSPGGEALLNSLGGKDEGIPFFAFLDPSGKAVSTSLMGKKGSNVGCPASAQEIQWFVSSLKKTVPSISATDLQVIQSALEHAESGRSGAQ